MHVARYPVPLAPAQTLPPRRGLRREPVFVALLALLDTLAFACAYLGFLELRRAGWGDPSAPGLSNLWPLALCLISIYVVFVAASRYSLRPGIETAGFAAEHVLACVIALSLALLLQFAVFIFDLSRSRVALMAAFVVFTPISLIFRRIISRAFRDRAGAQTFLIVGAGAEAVRFHHECRAHRTAQALRFVDLSGVRAGERLDGPDSPVIDWGRWEDFLALLDRSVEAVVVAEPFPVLPIPSVEALVCAHFHHAPILSLEAFYEKFWRKVPVVMMDPLWALRQDFRLSRDSSYRIFKRGIDLVTAVLGLLLALPLFLACALAIRLEDGGPVFYSQRRVGRDREAFTLYKFRTMRVAASGEKMGDLYTRDGDGRVTRVGRWLRRLRLDEMPQLWNVLRGEMSLIGPRAEWERCVRVYEKEIAGYHFRHLVKPGITGWAQVNYPYGQSLEDAVEKLEYDLYYIKNYSLLLDASIVLKTLYVILSFKGK